MMWVNNNPNATHWNIETGYENPFDKANYPYQGNFSTESIQFILALLMPKLDTEFRCNGFEQGYKLLLTMPGETTKMSQNYIRLSISHQNLIQLVPEWTITADELRHFKPNQRKCFFQSEKSLRFFKIYTQTNCEEECLANFTKIECECVKFSMPSKLTKY